MKITLELKNKLKAALREDIGLGDITSRTLISPKACGRAVIIAKAPGVFCGRTVLQEILHLVNPKIKARFFLKEGNPFREQTKIAEIAGPVISLLEAERTALNLLGHLCAIALHTGEFANKVKKYKVRILDTRKTTPLWRDLEKYAVKIGGGHNHRMGLYDALFVKENHRKFGDLSKLVNLKGQAQKKRAAKMSFEIEVRNEREMTEAFMLSPAVILFDNFKPADLKKAVCIARKCSPRTILEASGGITLKNVEAYAKTGVDQISIGALTHSVKAVDLSMLVK